MEILETLSGTNLESAKKNTKFRFPGSLKCKMQICMIYKCLARPRAKKICTSPQMHKMKQRTGLYTEFMLDNWAIHRSYQMTHCSHRVSISHNFNSILLVIRGTESNKLQYKLNYFAAILCSFGFQRTKLMVSKSNSTIK